MVQSIAPERSERKRPPEEIHPPSTAGEPFARAASRPSAWLSYGRFGHPEDGRAGSGVAQDHRREAADGGCVTGIWRKARWLSCDQTLLLCLWH